MTKFTIISILVTLAFNCPAQWEFTPLNHNICYETEDGSLKGFSYIDYTVSNGTTTIKLDSFSNIRYVPTQLEEDEKGTKYYITGNSDFGNHIKIHPNRTVFFFLNDSNKSILADSFVFKMDYPLFTEWTIFENDSFLLSGYLLDSSTAETYFGNDSIISIQLTLLNKIDQIKQYTLARISKSHGIIALPNLDKIRKGQIVSLVFRPYKFMSSFEFFDIKPMTTVEFVKRDKELMGVQSVYEKYHYYDSNNSLYFDKKQITKYRSPTQDTVLKVEIMIGQKFNNTFNTLDTFNPIPLSTQNAISIKFVCDSLLKIYRVSSPYNLKRIHQDTVLSQYIEGAFFETYYSYQQNIGQVNYYNISEPSQLEYYSETTLFIATPQCDSIGAISSELNSVSTFETDPIQIYPNPSRGKVTINTKLANSKVIIYDQLGKLVYSETLKSKDKATLDLSELQNGIYFIQIITKNEIGMKKFILEH